MEFVETHAFTRRIRELLSSEEFRLFQVELLGRPTIGDVISGTGGLRKVRWQTSGKGKRGGIRVIYFLHRPSERCLLLLAYGKNEKDDLSSSEAAILRRIVQGEYP